VAGAGAAAAVSVFAAEEEPELQAIIAPEHTRKKRIDFFIIAMVEVKDKFRKK